MRRIRQEWLDKFKAEDEEIEQEKLNSMYRGLEKWFKHKAASS